MAKKQSPAPIPTALMDFEIDNVRVPGLRSLVPSGGERRINYQRDFDGVQVQTFPGDIPSYAAEFNPSFALKVWSDLYDSWIDGDIKEFDLKTQEQELFNVAIQRIAITTAGVATFTASGSSAVVKPDADKGESMVGAVVKTGSGATLKYTPIIEVDGTTLKTEPIATAIAETAYEIIVPSMEWGFRGVVVGPVVPAFRDDATSIAVSIQPTVNIKLPLIGG